MLNLNPDERDKFAEMAAAWWDASGPCRTLHDINPCRLDYIAARVTLRGAEVADIGCGGGILSEALARAGAHVTAVDATAELIAVARAHAAGEQLDIDYELGTSDALIDTREADFDAVVCMELIEHVPDPDALIEDCARLVKPRGTLVLSTLNRTPQAYLLGIVAAEYALGVLPRGTHDYAQFVKPSELARSGRRHGLVLEDITGMAYNPLLHSARLCSSPSINYFATFRRPGR
jgi:2-polyprenyl-6-hydroxyphenyl methylase / 3-demethylubiquinone-9 3-methyltransferase